MLHNIKSCSFTSGFHIFFGFTLKEYDPILVVLVSTDSTYVCVFLMAYNNFKIIFNEVNKTADAKFNLTNKL